MTGSEVNVNVVKATRKLTHISSVYLSSLPSDNVIVNLLSGESQLCVPSLKKTQGSMSSWVSILSCMLCAS